MLSQKGSLLPIIGVLILVLLGGGIFYYFKSHGVKSLDEKNQSVITNQTSTVASPGTKVDSMDSWQTYTNPRYRYSIKYPSDYRMSTPPGPGLEETDRLWINSKCTYQSPDPCSEIQINASQSNPEKPFEASFFDDTLNNPSRISNTVKTELAGEPAQRSEYYFEGSGEGNNPTQSKVAYVFVVNHQTIKYSILYWENQEETNYKTIEDLQNKNEFDQIISTFKFIN